MWVNCKVVSDNILIYYKLKEFIGKTHFLRLSEENSKRDDNQIIFWDHDSVNIDVHYVKRCIDKGSIVIVLSSIFPKNILNGVFEENQRMKIGSLTKTAQYNQFVEEISRLIDVLNS